MKSPSTFLGFTPYWDSKPTNAFHSHSPGVYTSDKILISTTINKNHLKTNIFDGSIVDGLRQPLFFSFVLDKPNGYKIFCEPKKIQFNKMNESVLNSITFYLEDDNHEEVDFNGETLTFTIQKIKI